jgi:predicted PurR-regulated permease PerM
VGKPRTYILVFLAVVFSVSVLLIPSVASQGNAQSMISSAKNTITQCYGAAQQAESAGANVDSLISMLNQAAGSLSKAELAYSSGDYAAAYSAASQCQSQLSGFVSQANDLKQNAQAASSQSFLFTVLSLVSSVFILCAGVGAWIGLNRRERRSAQ